MRPERVNGLTLREFQQFQKELWFADCERKSIDAVFEKWFRPDGCQYPDEWYADKDNRMMGRETGWLRCLVSQGGKMVWVDSKLRRDGDG